MTPSQNTDRQSLLPGALGQTFIDGLQQLQTNLVQRSDSDSLEIRESLHGAQLRLQEKESNLAFLQHRYESLNKNYHKTRQECNRLGEANAASEKRMQKQKDEITKLKDERTELKRDLETARGALKSGGGSVAELENAQEEIRRLTKDNASQVRKADYERNQAEYTREQYQTASTAAAQLGIENRELRDENETLKRKVAGEVSRLKEITVKNDESHHLSRIAQLESMLTTRESVLDRKEKELHEIKKYRPSTRSTSIQPRSPRIGPTSRPSSPGFVSRGSQLRYSSEPGTQ